MLFESGSSDLDSMSTSTGVQIPVRRRFPRQQQLRKREQQVFSGNLSKHQDLPGEVPPSIDNEDDGSDLNENDNEVGEMKEGISTEKLCGEHFGQLHFLQNLLVQSSRATVD